ncbi:MAG TPA: hypothetical protein PLD62_04545 [Candidatus Cloacimonadota bacterium]|nr:hypothetical protein [Candidatus Cloacimonadota bacterium]
MKHKKVIFVSEITNKTQSNGTVYYGFTVTFSDGEIQNIIYHCSEHTEKEVLLKLENKRLEFLKIKQKNEEE